MKSTAHPMFNLPAEVPVMVLPGATLFTRALMPLYIFEPRYRAMLRDSLAGSRMFCVAMMKPGLSEAENEDDFFHVAGLGLVRACVQNTDGTSHLILEGIARVELRNFVQASPFRVARIRELEPLVPKSEAIAEIAAAVVQRAKAIQHPHPESRASLDACLDSLDDDPGALADLLSHSFVGDPMRRQSLLEELNVCKRMSMLLDALGG